MQIPRSREGFLWRQVQASLPQDPPLQVQGSQVDLPLEHLRRGERPDLLPLISGSLIAQQGGLPRHRVHRTRGSVPCWTKVKARVRQRPHESAFPL
jgi:hypothetical protein